MDNVSFEEIICASETGKIEECTAANPDKGNVRRDFFFGTDGSGSGSRSISVKYLIPPLPRSARVV